MPRHFAFQEFDCPCCGKNWVNLKLIRVLDSVREEYGLPISVSSGYRCEKHNAEVGGIAGSQHVLGMAADLRASDMNALYDICVKYFKAVGDGRLKNFIHVDLRPDLHRWNYPV